VASLSPFLLALLLCGSALGAKPPAKVLEVIDGSGPRVIPLTVQAPKYPDGTHKEAVVEGTVDLTFRPTSTKPQHVRVLLASKGLTGVKELRHIVLRPHVVREVSVQVELPHGDQPEALDGELLIDARGASATLPVPQASIAVTAAIAAAGDVRFAPDPTVVQVTRWCLAVFPCNTQDGGTVNLYGSGVSSLIAGLEAAGQSTLTTKLRSGSETLDVELTELTADREHPGTATARLHLESKPSPGTYRGAIPVSPLLPDAPTLKLIVHSRYMFIWAVLSIFLGVLSAGFFYQQFGLSRRKRLLREMLVNTINGEYWPHQDDNQPDGPDKPDGGGGPLIWELEVTCPLRDNPQWTPYSPLDTAANIYTAIYWARNDADLNEAEAAAIDLAAKVKTWVVVIAEIRVLWKLVQEDREDESQWNTMKVATDSHLLLRMARRAPGSAKDSEALVEMIRRQTAWHQAMAEAWDTRARLASLKKATSPGAKKVGEAALKVELPALAKSAQSILTRTPSQQDELDVELETLYGKLLDLTQASQENSAIRDVEAVQLTDPGRDAEREAQSAQLLREISSLESTTPITFALIAAGKALLGSRQMAKAPEPTAAPARTTGFAWPTGHKRAARSRPPAPPTTGSPSYGLLRRLQLLDIVLSLAVLLGLTVLYAATVYGPGWGSVSDWGSAFGAGFAGHGAVKWALLPTYRSLRKPAVPEQEQAAAAAPATQTG
jgi:hypothetical protein